jgi:hypothetical protein
MKSTPKRLPPRPQDMSLPRYDWLLELCSVAGLSPEDAEDVMGEPGFLVDWELRIDRLAESEELAALAKRALLVGLAEGDPDAIALAATPEGQACLARVLPKKLN